MSLDKLAGQVLDKLADLVVGPVLGDVATLATVQAIVPQGATGTLADGRRIRCRTSTTVVTGATATDVPCRLMYLTPSYPKAGNFAPVGPQVVTWDDPPTGITAAASVVSSWAPHQDLACVGAVGESHYYSAGPAEFAAGGQGSKLGAVVVHMPETTTVGGSGGRRIQFVSCTYRIEVVVSTLGLQKDRRGNLFDIESGLRAALQGARIGALRASIESWKQIAKNENDTRWELRVTVLAAFRGRAQRYLEVMRDQGTNKAIYDLVEFSHSTVVNDDGSQPNPFTVEEIVGV